VRNDHYHDMNAVRGSDDIQKVFVDMVRRHSCRLCGSNAVVSSESYVDNGYCALLGGVCWGGIDLAVQCCLFCNWHVCAQNVQHPDGAEVATLPAKSGKRQKNYSCIVYIFCLLSPLLGFAKEAVHSTASWESFKKERDLLQNQFNYNIKQS